MGGLLRLPQQLPAVILAASFSGKFTGDTETTATMVAVLLKDSFGYQIWSAVVCTIRKVDPEFA
jgi:hypothetical protein